MLTRRVIPCLDCCDGRVVKGVRFADLRDVGSPSELAAAYQSQGADEIVLLDVAATVEARAHQVDTVRAVREVLSIPLTVGGGVRSLKDAARLLEAGADKVAVNSAAAAQPEIIDALSSEFGAQCTVLSVDAADDGRGGWRVVVRSGKEQTAREAIAWVREGVERGAGEILLTSLDRDGTRAGYDLMLVRQAARVVNVPVIASGGAASATHFFEALEAGADAVLAAGLFHEGATTVGDVKAYLSLRGIEVRR